VLIDRTHRAWAAGSGAAAAAAAAAYAWSRAGAIAPFSGGSPLGLMFGIGAFALMIVAALLPARRRVRTWRIGRAQTWMRGHLWLGALSVPLVLLHAGLGFGGGSLARTLMVLLALVTVSGLVGVALQQIVPKVLMEQVPLETIYEQIGHVRRQIVEEADLIVATMIGAKPPANPHASAEERAAAVLNAITIADPAGVPTGAGVIREFHLSQLRPFLSESPKAHPLADAGASRQAFASLRLVTPEASRGGLDDLESICQEQQQLRRQERLHLVLHGWLFVHAPLSFALIALAVVHIVMALRY
jgi:hypothetical protein